MVVPNIQDLGLIDKLKELDIYSFFDTMTKTEKSITYIVMAVEIAIEFYVFINWLPKFLSARFAAMRNKSKNDVEVWKAIQTKIDNNLELSRREQKLYKKLMKGKE
ncbi:hypothetical protein HLA87_02490 [Mycoplasma miroungigenitalium]|uniref:Uncharacterized protein n=1 Tax=Mycoplasma miroungigenitalium TaxID=754515 RepID=A0A6M4JAA9_9MOLU|nr:hypothetical protein [Mycoplasma miroungigenitalium]QJR43198.1 hypothetical protein HLA87_02490 [Mycoplasma miroungigenitalium]